MTGELVAKNLKLRGGALRISLNLVLKSESRCCPLLTELRQLRTHFKNKYSSLC